MTLNITQSDAREWLRSLDDASVDLIATDPPFGPGMEFDARWDGTEGIGDYATDILITAAQVALGSNMSAYLSWLGMRLKEMHRVLMDDGSIYLHCDHTAHAWVKALMDGIFGYSQFRNELVWERTTSRSDGKQFGRTHDTILYYSKSNRRTWNPVYTPLSAGGAKPYKHDDHDGNGVYRLRAISTSHSPGYFYDLGFGEKTPKNGYCMTEKRAREWLDEGRLVVKEGKVPVLKKYLSECKGAKLGTVWQDIRAIAPNANERTDYPTQKPLALYERIISASSNEGDLVADPFCGSGTTLVAAKRLGRRFAGCDVNPEAVSLTCRRLS